MTKDELIEELADIEHQRWSDWQKNVHSKSQTRPCTTADGLYVHPTGRREIPADLVERWERQIETPFADLSEPEKDKDREQVMRYWPLLVEFVAGWMEANKAVNGGGEGTRYRLADKWREEMA